MSSMARSRLLEWAAVPYIFLRQKIPLYALCDIVVLNGNSIWHCRIRLGWIHPKTRSLVQFEGTVIIRCRLINHIHPASYHVYRTFVDCTLLKQYLFVLGKIYLILLLLFLKLQVFIYFDFLKFQNWNAN